MAPTKKNYNKNPKDYVLNFDTLKKYITETKGCCNIKSLTIKYSSNYKLIAYMLRKLRPELIERSMKERFAKIVNILDNSEIPPLLSPSEEDFNGFSSMEL